MTGGRWQRIEQLFQSAIPLSTQARADLLERECADDAAMRAEIDSLLEAEADSGDFLTPPSKASAAPMDESDTAGSARLGVWRIVRPLGQGGMGEVYEAVRADGLFQQRAAIKLMRVDARDLQRRFQAERQILARLDHPGIARLLDGGVSSDGRSYAVMDYVEGQAITDYCRVRNAGLRQRLELFVQVCDAVAHAHRHLIVHRDLKPANILVDGGGRVRLLDFGIAKLLEPGLWAGSAETAGTQVPLTPDYCAPEQLTGETVTTATDVYALGLLLFELLTEQRPWPAAGKPLARVMRLLLETPAPNPSDVALPAKSPPVPVRSLRGDLDAIVAVCLRREPQHRYQTVDALQRDIERHLAGEPVVARSGQRTYVFGRFLRRYRWAAAAVMALIAALTAGLAGTLWQASRARQEAAQAVAVQDFLVDIFQANTSAQPDPVKARQTTARELLDNGARKIETALPDAPQSKLALLDVLARLYDDLALPDEETRLREQAVEIVRASHGADSAELAGAFTSLATAMHGSKRTPAEREAALTQAEAILDRRRDTTSPMRARLLRSQAEYYQMSDLPRALDYATRSIAIAASRPESRELAQAWYQRGLIESYSGQSRAAMKSLDQALAITLRVSGERDPNLIVLHYQRAETGAALGDHDAAEQSARRALELALAINGEEHVGAARSRMQLGAILCDAGRWQEGLELLAEAKRSILKIRGPDDPFHTPAILWANGKQQARAGHFAAGRTDLEAALAIEDRRDGRTLLAAVIREELARASIETGQVREAAARLDQARSIRLGIGQSDRDAGLNSNRALRIQLLLDAEDNAGARAQLATYVIQPKQGTMTAPTQLGYWLLQGSIALAEGDMAAALASAARVRTELEGRQMPPESALQLAWALWLQGKAEIGLGQPGMALPRLQEALALRERWHAPFSPKLAEAQITLADCYLALGQVDEARAMIVLARALHAQHPELAQRYRQALASAEARLAEASG